MDRDSVLDLKEVTEQTAVNCAVDMSGENCDCNDICVLRVLKGLRNEFYFKTAYRNCECECVNVTWSGARLCLELVQNVQLKKRLILIVFPFSTGSMKTCSQHEITKLSHTAIQVFTAD